MDRASTVVYKLRVKFVSLVPLSVQNKSGLDSYSRTSGGKAYEWNRTNFMTIGRVGGWLKLLLVWARPVKKYVVAF